MLPIYTAHRRTWVRAVLWALFFPDPPKGRESGRSKTHTKKPDAGGHRAAASNRIFFYTLMIPTLCVTRGAAVDVLRMIYWAGRGVLKPGACRTAATSSKSVAPRGKNSRLTTTTIFSPSIMMTHSKIYMCWTVHTVHFCCGTRLAPLLRTPIRRGPLKSVPQSTNRHHERTAIHSC